MAVETQLRGIPKQVTRGGLRVASERVVLQDFPFAQIFCLKHRTTSLLQHK